MSKSSRTPAPAPTSAPSSAATPIHLRDLLHLRQTLPPPDFRLALRCYLLDHPQVRLQRVADELGITRQRVGWLAGRLRRPNCCPAGPRSALEMEKAAAGLAELTRRVAAGEPATRVAAELDLSLSQAARLGFRAKAVKPLHGEWERVRLGCGCWRCRRVAGVAVPRGPRITAEQQAAVLDWCAWVDPDSGEGLSRREVGRLVGVGPRAVDRVARVMKQEETDGN